jgi:hypothetical protein
MHLARRTRLITLLIAVWAILFGQLALAGYSCPSIAKVAEIVQMADAGMPCAQSMSRTMDEERPGLCHAHCQAAQSSPDTYQPPVLASLLQLGPVLTVASLEAAPQPLPALKANIGLPEGGPPLTIRNCCFRN